MSGTVAVGALRVEDWERELIAAATERAVASVSRYPDHHDLPDVAGDAAADPLWPSRSLNDALAGLGPVRPMAQADVEPWSRAALHDELAMATSQFAAGAEGAITAWSPAGDEFNSLTGATSIPPPPPPRPSRQFPPFEAVAEPGPRAMSDIGNARLPDFDIAGVEIVRALATADLARIHGGIDPAHPLANDLDLMEPGPMIIERAKAEQELGVLPGLPPVPWANPLHGLAIGFALSLMTGAALYMVLTGG